jgi:hypothetical protein
MRIARNVPGKEPARTLIVGDALVAQIALFACWLAVLAQQQS